MASVFYIKSCRTNLIFAQIVPIYSLFHKKQKSYYLTLNIIRGGIYLAKHKDG